MVIKSLAMLANFNDESFFHKIFLAAKTNHPKYSPNSMLLRERYIINAYRHRSDIDNFIKRLMQLPNVDQITSNPQLLGVIEWPYIHNEWDVRTKLDKIATHYEILSELNSNLIQINNETSYQLADLGCISKDVIIVMDKASWFIREGELLINTFRNGLRVASIAFTLAYQGAKKVAYVGAIQGIHSGISTEDSLEIYRMLTKDFEGLRPRSLLLEVLKVLLKKLDVSVIYAVSEQNRHHRHAYFGNNQNTVFNNNYNSIWDESGGIFDPATGFYEISIKPAVKDMELIASKKRSLYKRRYEIINALVDKVDLEGMAISKTYAEPISAKTPDWSREYKPFFAWDPGRSLLASIRSYQSLSLSKNYIKRLLKKFAVIRHVFWSVIAGAEIPLNAKIGGGLLIPHPNGIVIHSDAEIGPNCIIFQQVTIGIRGESSAPKIGGHVDIGAGARVIGNVCVGNHAKIGANAVVLVDVPATKTAVGVPAKII